MIVGRTTLNLVLFSTGLLAAFWRAPQQETGPQQPQRYARVSEAATRIHNLADEKGKVIARPKVGDVVGVFAEKGAGWVEVEVPGGFPVWVYGRFLSETATEGVCEVTGNAVNIRPEPSSDVTNFPLPQRLQAGDKVERIELLDPTKPMRETWVRIWSPPGVRGLMRAATLEELPEGSDGAALWRAALKKGDRVLPAAGTEAPKVAGAPTVERPTGELEQELATLVEALEAERIKATPDFGSVRGSLEGLARRAQTGTVGLEIRQALQKLGHYEEAAALRAELERERQARLDQVLRQQEAVRVESQKKDPLGDVFLARGVLERRSGSDGIGRYFLHFGGQTTCELFCGSGRYDLDTYRAFEVGVQGSLLPDRTSELSRIEISRLEVLKRR